MIDQDLKRSLGQMIKGVQVVASAHDGVERGYCSHWVCQVSFEEPILLASVSPKHDTHPLIAASGRFAVSILAADQVDVGQYFSYPGRRFRHLAPEHLETIDGLPVVRGCIAWLHCEVIGRQRAIPGLDATSGSRDASDSSGSRGSGVHELDHELFFGRVTAYGAGRLGEPPLLYSSRLGWRATGDKAREPGTSIRDALLERLAALEPAPSEPAPGDAP